MRRLVRVLIIAVLGFALFPAVLAASPLAARSYDLRSQVFLAVFGETSDGQLSIAAVYGDPLLESPLRNLALTPRAVELAASFLPDASTAPTFAQSSNPLGNAVAPGLDLARLIRPDAAEAVSAFTVAAYQPVAVSQVSPEPGALSFGPLVNQTAGSPARTSAVYPRARSASNIAQVPAAGVSLVHVGPVRFQGRIENASTQVPSISLRDNAYDAGADFAVRAGQRNLNFDLSSSYERLSRNDGGLTPSALGSSWALPAGNTALVLANNANLSRLALGAGVAVPVVSNLTLNLNYGRARLLGGYGLPGLTNLDAIDNEYGGKLIFAMPHSSSTLSFSAYQYRYQDNIVPANNQTQTRENVNFTVKF
ncbi:MAG TPA: hypothetical protein VNG31_02450 [Candidatus Baltobacteraceae bacterium]|nr:hypothetical protein [Candidatus Baltobacteraceae bacterium]